MDTDIVTLANSFMHDNRHLETKMSTSDVGLITSWIQVQLLRERQSWKEKLDIAMAEIERQRKTALSWESKCEAAEKVPERTENDFASENLSILVQSQKKRIEQVEKRLQGLLTDRKLCMDLLKMNSSAKDISVSQTLRQTLRTMEKDTKKMELNYQKEIAMKSKEIESLREEVRLLRQELVELEKKKDDNRLRNENGMQVLCYTTTDKLFSRFAKQKLDNKELNAPLQSVVDDLYDEKTRLSGENKRLHEVVASLEEEMKNKESMLRKYEKQIKTLKHDTTYRRNEIARKAGKGERKTGTTTPIEETFKRQHAGPLTLTKFKNKYSSLPSLPLSRNVEAPMEDTTRSTPIIQTAKTAVHRCLRCNRLYRLMDNNKFSCHYHKKGKIRQETMAPSGKVLEIAYRWECCNRSSSSQGCCRSQHV